MPRKIYQIAEEITKDWVKPNYAVKPYLYAMLDLDDTSCMYGYDSAKSIVNYFLANAQTWKGEIAKRVKKELKEIVK